IGGPPVLAHVGPDTGGDVVVDGADHLDLDAVLLHNLGADVDQTLGVAELRRAFERAVDEQTAQPSEVIRLSGHGVRSLLVARAPIRWPRSTRAFRLREILAAPPQLFSSAFSVRAFCTA